MAEELRNDRRVNPDLLAERAKCTFRTEELTHLLDGGRDKTEERHKKEAFFLNDPLLQDAVPMEYLSHKEKFEEATRKACHLFRKVQHLQNEGQMGMDGFRQILGGQLGSAIIKDGNPLALHYVMFIPTLMGQGTVEQQAEWMAKAWNCEIVGTYAQTELGHGTFVRGIETTATYDPNTEQFVINSPTLTSYKWWPGGLAHTANYAVVVAQLYTKGVCHGIHPFIVQLRDLDTHMPLPGIRVGEIGTKLGMNTTNNGYLALDHVRIPRSHMLMKNNKVLADGTYVKAINDKLTYGTMVFVRVLLVRDSVDYLAKAVTIATRYSAVRRQSQPKPNEPEPQILDYVTQQHKLLPLLGTCLAYRYCAEWVWDMYNNVSTELEKGELDKLPELHAAACCLKAVSTADSARGVEVCRLACGGHGYMTASNLPATYGLVTAACTYEGENTVLLLQTARFLMKAWLQAVEGQSMTPTVQYLADFRGGRLDIGACSSPAALAQAMATMAAGRIALASKHMSERVRQGEASEDAWNNTSIEWLVAAEAHCRVLVVNKYLDKVLSLKPQVSSALFNVLWDVMELYTVDLALKCSGDLLRFTPVNAQILESLQRRLEQLLAKIRPNAVGLVDSFNISDQVLGSALGAYDGRVYERLFQEASKSPLNQEPVNKSFQSYLKPFLRGSKL